MWRFALFESLEYDDCLYITCDERWLLDDYLNEYGDFIFFCLNSLTDKNKILQGVSDPMALVEVCALQVLLVHFVTDTLAFV